MPLLYRLIRPLLARAYSLAMVLCAFFSVSVTVVHASAGVRSSVGDEASYVGAASCQQCHQSQYADWQNSHHFRSMLPANEASVLGDFSGQVLEFHGLETRYFKRDQRYWVSTRNRHGKIKTYPVLFTFGFSPLQQYLVETDNGHLQALNVAWDSRPKVDGGQRWFHLQADTAIDAEHPFFWDRYFQNWNARCADCHSTGLQKKYNPADHSYDTQWAEVNVACEACHGPASQHVEQMQQNPAATVSGFAQSGSPALPWQFKPNNPIAQPVNRHDRLKNINQQIDQCGGCHSRRSQLSPMQGNNYHDNYSIALLRDGLYYPDGQIEDEVFVLGSFLQSKMYRAGVTCNNCHDPHSTRLKLAGNALCSQCHLPTQYDNSSHHQHKADSTGSQCVNCHMPERTYMQVDRRRDHGFHIPNPVTAQSTSSPDTCLSCHQEKDAQWSRNAYQRRFGDPTADAAALAIAGLRNRDPLSVRAAEQALTDPKASAIGRGSLVVAMSTVPSRVSLQAALSQLDDADPIVRRAALESLAGLNPDQRWRIAAPLLEDPVRSVRFAAAVLLASQLSQLPEAQSTSLQRELDAYQTSLRATMDHPSSLLQLSNLALDLGNASIARQHLQQALKIQPGYTAASLNLAYLYQTSQQPEKEQTVLQKALVQAPDDANVLHAYGLYLVRSKQYDQASSYLAKAVNADNAQPRHAYLHAVAVENSGQRQQAISLLKHANQRWPNQYDILMTLVLYLDQEQGLTEAAPYLSQLSAIAPNSPQVKAYLKRLQNQL
ncbi:hypothetical protein MIB92_12370 [Aestuariirhabdus sp. Z084]|uniref:tetratricopeptide repeat protein n=1 Tax=Aestuariirhabdus haliotis TaxID=2918751 RepID=UPI00201B41E9|nr:tetratricopeptide repeat protein [Aestuariirhabdus haliotis]MCL6416449.1 hypothetical protein [Aestuariirhabdus haliotis]MCL6420384.1 hypothetical protein [Aestuariirhabdus haliotis]